jgi:hypothetical protein
MENVIQYFPNASWASITGSFTASELRDIADRIDNPELREDKDGDKK